MKRILIILGFAILGLTACQKDDATTLDNYDTGVIFQYDYRECFCCGGYFIEIDNDTLRFYQVPDNSDLVIEDETMPISVKLEWDTSDIQCMGDEIDVIEIYKQ